MVSCVLSPRKNFGKTGIPLNDVNMNNLDTTLKNHGLRSTLFRTRVLEIFIKSKHALSLPDIEDKLSEFDRITLYRTLKSFEEKGLIHKLSDNAGSVKYAACEGECDEGHHHDNHVHFHCEKCGKSFCLDHMTVPDILTPEGYKVESRDMMLKGTCKECNQKK